MHFFAVTSDGLAFMSQTSDKHPVVRFCLCQTRVALQRWMRIRTNGGRTQEFGECVRKGDVLQGGGERERKIRERQGE